MLNSFMSFLISNILCFTLMAQDNPSYKLVSLLGEELIARHSNELIAEIKNGDINSLKILINNIKQTDLNFNNCFDIADFFGNPNNKYAPNRDFDMGVIREILLNCNEILQNINELGGIDGTVLGYFIKNTIIR